MSGKDGLMIFRVKVTLASGYSIIKATLAEDARKRKREGSRLWRILGGWREGENSDEVWAEKTSTCSLPLPLPRTVWYWANQEDIASQLVVLDTILYLAGRNLREEDFRMRSQFKGCRPLWQEPCGGGSMRLVTSLLLGIRKQQVDENVHAHLPPSPHCNLLETLSQELGLQIVHQSIVT